MSEHTQEPWHTGGNGTIIYDAAGWGIASATVYHGRQEPEASLANACRIVACVNFCAGVSNEELVDGVSAFGGLEAIIRYILEQKKLRDEMLAALKDTAAKLESALIAHPRAVPVLIDEGLEFAKAAIAKCEQP